MSPNCVIRTHQQQKHIHRISRNLGIGIKQPLLKVRSTKWNYTHFITNKRICWFPQKIVCHSLLFPNYCFVNSSPTVLTSNTPKPPMRKRKMQHQRNNFSLFYTSLGEGHSTYLIHSIDISIMFQQSIDKVKFSRCS